MKKVGFIGAGNMATAIIGGILKKGILKPQEMIASRRSADKLQALTQQYGIAVTTDNTEAAGAQIVVLAVKPQFLAGVLAAVRHPVRDEPHRPLPGGRLVGRTYEGMDDSRHRGYEALHQRRR